MNAWMLEWSCPTLRGEGGDEAVAYVRQTAKCGSARNYLIAFHNLRKGTGCHTQKEDIRLRWNADLQNSVTEGNWHQDYSIYFFNFSYKHDNNWYCFHYFNTVKHEVGPMKSNIKIFSLTQLLKKSYFSYYKPIALFINIRNQTLKNANIS